MANARRNMIWLFTVAVVFYTQEFTTARKVCEMPTKSILKCPVLFEYKHEVELCFHVTSDNGTFTTMLEYCRSMASDLLKIDRAKMADALTEEMLGRGKTVWIGLQKENSNETFKWTVDDSDFHKEDFPVLPANQTGNGGCVSINIDAGFAPQIEDCNSALHQALCARHALDLPDRPEVYFLHNDRNIKMLKAKLGTPIAATCHAILRTKGKLVFAILGKDGVESYIDMNDTRVKYREDNLIQPGNGQCGRYASAVLKLTASAEVCHKRVACISYKMADVSVCSYKDAFCSATVMIEVDKELQDSLYEDLHFLIMAITLSIICLLIIFLAVSVRRVLVYESDSFIFEVPEEVHHGEPFPNHTHEQGSTASLFKQKDVEGQDKATSVSQGSKFTTSNKSAPPSSKTTSVRSKI